jgi:Fe-S-cluster-containing dehydrogenase component
MADLDQMMKCDMCTDRTSEGDAPMCASVCPSEALWYGTPEQFHATRRGALVDGWLFGGQRVTTKVYAVVDDLEPGPIDVASAATGTWLDDPFGLEDDAP